MRRSPGQFDQILESADRRARLQAFAPDHGFVLSKRLIDAEIASLPRLRGLDGKFSEQAYPAFLQQQQMTDADVRRLIDVAIIQRLLLGAGRGQRAGAGRRRARPMPRCCSSGATGRSALVPAARSAPDSTRPTPSSRPSIAQNRQRYTVPEQRVLRICRDRPEQVAGVDPTEAEIAAYYKANQADLRRQRNRRDQPGGRAGQAAGRRAFAARARRRQTSSPPRRPPASRRGRHRRPADPRAIHRASPATRSPPPRSRAAQGAVVGPVRSDLGWHVIKIDDIRGAAGKSLAQVRAEIAAR